MHVKDYSQSTEVYDIYRKRPHKLDLLSKLKNWKMGDNEPDPCGCKLYDNSGRAVGSVDDLLIDTNSREAVFMVVSYGGRLGIGAKETLDRHISLNQRLSVVSSRYS